MLQLKITGPRSINPIQYMCQGPHLIFFFFICIHHIISQPFILEAIRLGADLMLESTLCAA
jgi:hypothetical protein